MPKFNNTNQLYFHKELLQVSNPVEETALISYTTGLLKCFNGNTNNRVLLPTYCFSEDSYQHILFKEWLFKQQLIHVDSDNFCISKDNKIYAYPPKTATVRRLWKTPLDNIVNFKHHSRLVECRQTGKPLWNNIREESYKNFLYKFKSSK